MVCGLRDAASEEAEAEGAEGGAGNEGTLARGEVGVLCGLGDLLVRGGEGEGVEGEEGEEDGDWMWLLAGEMR